MGSPQAHTPEGFSYEGFTWRPCRCMSWGPALISSFKGRRRLPLALETDLHGVFKPHPAHGQSPLPWRKWTWLCLHTTSGLRYPSRRPFSLPQAPVLLIQPRSMPSADFLASPGSWRSGGWWERCGRLGLGPTGPGKLPSPRKWGGVSRGRSFCVLILRCGHRRKHRFPSQSVLPGLSSALRPPRSTQPPSFSSISPTSHPPPTPATLLQAHSKWGLHVKISQLFLSLLSTIFIRRSEQSRAEKRENIWLCLPSSIEIAPGWAIFNKMNTPVL